MFEILKFMFEIAIELRSIILYNTTEIIKRGIAMINNLSVDEYKYYLNLLNGELDEIIKNSADLPVIEVKSLLIEAMLTHGKIYIDEKDTFPHRIVQNGKMFEYRTNRINAVTDKLSDKLSPFRDGQEVLLYTGDVDFSHTVPDWKRLFATGFSGIINELEQHLSADGLTSEQRMYYSCALRVYRAITVYIDNIISEISKYGEFDYIVDSYKRIASDIPKTLLDVLTFIILFYTVQMDADVEMLRSVGGLDELLSPYYENDLKCGYTEAELDCYIKNFMLQLREFGFANNIPFYLCKTDFSGHTVCNEMSYRLLKIYSDLNVQDPKIQIRCGNDIPDDLILLAMNSIRKGNNSIVFMNDTAVLPALERIGISRCDAENYTPVGCYEPSAFGELACTCAGRVSLPKVVELTLSNGKDYYNGKVFEENPYKNDNWDNFYKNFLYRLKNAVEASKQITGIFESGYEDMNPSLVLSPTYVSSMEKGIDLYGGGAKYNNTSINVFGIASAVDALEVIKNLVFVENELTCEELSEILKNNWADNEKLRLKCEKRYLKYGNGDNEADGLSKNIVDSLSEMINGTKNYRGGVFRLGMFSIDWYTQFGEKIGATADGRFAQDVISKNMSAVIGRDKTGITGIIRSSATADGKEIPNGTVLDLILDASATKGEDGLTVMLGILKTFIKLGGTALQINVLDPEVLKKAQKNPKEYSTLQVRLCGWNVYFTELSVQEQNEFIKMAENVAK